ncbi:PspC domain-containing protein [Candidatus Solirubrobacter pratensis]|uniref:PspC domain-containing protein n=1 Tax=Candidatus Solirubrobacter pratensis TaxID=1298857 RepID=UPI0003F8B098|nr:PspC domain-containing protein [Candidatus Solirubrobacter pratensis]
MSSTPATPPAKRLARSTSDHMVAGVAGGLGTYFGLDPVLFRIAFGISVFFGGIGLLAYVALVAFLPYDDGRPSWIDGRSRATTIVATVCLAIAAVSFLGPPAFVLGPGLLALAVLGLLAVLLYRAFGGERGDDAAQVIARGTLVLLVLIASLGAATGVGFVAAIGGGVAVAIIAIAAGVTLLAAGLLGGPRWLILPAIVLVLPLAVVSAADIDLRGGVGERDYRPASVAALRPEYRVGAGQLKLDLRALELPAGRTDVKLVVGVGEAVVRVPEDACVSTDAQIGVGQADLPGGDGHGGLDVSVADAAPRAGHPVVHVNADIGVGHLQIERDGLTSGTEPVCA